MMKRERAKRERAAKQTRRKRRGKLKKYYFTHVISEYPPGTFDCPASTVEPGMP